MKSVRSKAVTALVAVLTAGAVSATPAFASEQPFVETEPATSVGETTATLNGVVNPDGRATSYYFEYGETALYGKQTTTTSAGSGEKNVKESKAITGLSAGTTYHFRIAATYYFPRPGAYGADEVLVTSGSSAPSAQTNWATSIKATAATVTGTVNPHGLETKYYFEYGTEGKYTHKTAEASAGSGTAGVEESKAITGLTEGTKYNFRIVATNSKGTTDGPEEAFAAEKQPEFTGTFPQKVTGTVGGAEFRTLGYLSEPSSYRAGVSSGEITGPSNLADVVVTLKEADSEYPCTQAYEGKELVTNELVGRVGYINRTSKEVGLLLKPKSGPIAKCWAESFGDQEWVGSVVGRLTPVNESTKSFKIYIESEGSGSELKQKFTKFEGEEGTHELENIWGSGKRALVATGELTLELSKAVELKA